MYPKVAMHFGLSRPAVKILRKCVAPYFKYLVYGVLTIERDFVVKSWLNHFTRLVFHNIRFQFQLLSQQRALFAPGLNPVPIDILLAGLE